MNGSTSFGLFVKNQMPMKQINKEKKRGERTEENSEEGEKTGKTSTV